MNLLLTLRIWIFSFLSFFFGKAFGQEGSFQIDTNFIDGFKTNIYMLSQQRSARLFGKSRNESQSSESDFYEQIGASEAFDVEDRHGDTPIANTEHLRRAVDLKDADWGDLIDKLDRVRLLIRPDDAYVKTAVMALNRKKDDVFIAAALGIARAGKRGTTQISLPDSQKLVAVDEGTGLSSGLNVFTLTRINEMYDDADIEEPEEEGGFKRYFAYTGRQKRDLLRNTEVTSSDFNSVQTLVRGLVNDFMGMEFIRSNRLPVTAATTFHDAEGAVGPTGPSFPNNIVAGARRCISWIEDGMISSHGIDMDIDIGPRRDKRNATQIYVLQSVGAVRMEEVKVIEVICDET